LQLKSRISLWELEITAMFEEDIRTTGVVIYRTAHKTDICSAEVVLYTKGLLFYIKHSKHRQKEVLERERNWGQSNKH
jgi:hypothetical protein